MKLSIIIPTIGRESLKSVLEAIFLSNNFDQIKPEIIIVVDGAKIDGVLKPVQDDKRVVFLKTAQ